LFENKLGNAVPPLLTLPLSCLSKSLVFARLGQVVHSHGSGLKVEGRLVRTIRREGSSLSYDSFKMRNRTHE
jgi:hypothetical protein